jgi:L-histidine N-alpha-methyltransferase
MRLRSTLDQAVHVKELGLSVEFAQGEDLLTEISAKFVPTELENELLASDFVLDAMWGADEGEFLLVLAHPYC